MHARHRIAASSGPYGFSHCVATGSYQGCDPASHGGIRYEDVCSCGARRTRNTNGGRVERSPWIEPDEDLLRCVTLEDLWLRFSKLFDKAEPPVDREWLSEATLARRIRWDELTRRDLDALYDEAMREVTRKEEK